MANKNQKYGLRKRSGADAKLTEEDYEGRKSAGKRGKREFVLPELVDVSS